MKKQANYPCDVLIIGGGSAGLRAQLKFMMPVPTFLLSVRAKKEIRIQRLQEVASMTTGPVEPDDTWIIHAADTLREGEFLAAIKDFEILARVLLML